MTNIIKILVLSAALYVISPRNAETVVSERFLRETVEHLCSPSLGGRASGTPGAQNAALWLGARFREEGLECPGGSYQHGFHSGKFFGRNILGYIPGTGEDYVVVMAHYDNLGSLGEGFYPGADSNASGVASLLQLARMFVKMRSCGKKYSSGILFVALDGKEEDLAGSRELWNKISAGRYGFKPENLRMVVNLDQLGSTLSPIHQERPDYLLMLSTENGRRRDLENAMRLQQIEMDVAYDYYGSKDFTNLFYRRVSDQRVFLENGIPSVMFTSGITMLTNKVTDTPSSLDYKILLRRTRLIFYYLDRVLQ